MSSSANPRKRAGEQRPQQDLPAALSWIPAGLFVLTARHEERRAGLVTSLVQRVCDQPPMLCLAVAKGTPIMPLISESRQFGLCQLGEDDRLLLRKFSREFDPGEDPFLGFELRESKLPGLPLLAHCFAHFECELTCHLDVEGDHDLFVGTVRAGHWRGDGKPWVYLGDDGQARG